MINYRELFTDEELLDSLNRAAIRKMERPEYFEQLVSFLKGQTDADEKTIRKQLDEHHFISG